MIPEVAPYNNYTGNGSTTQFDFDFYIEDASQLIVKHTSSNDVTTTLTKDTDYSIHEVGNKNGSYITFPIASSSYSTLTSQETISLTLTLPIAQESEYGTSSELDLRSLEYSLDYLTRICQIQERQLDRAVKVREGSNISTDTLAQNLNKVADISTDVSTVAGISADVTAVKNNATDVSTVAGISADVTTVAGISADVSSVADISTDVSTVAGISADVSSVAADLTNIDSVAADLTNIDAASSYAVLAKQYAVGLPSEPEEYSAKYWAAQAAAGQIQSDWSQSDNAKKDYIKNKPTLLSSFTDNLGSNPTHTHSQYELINKTINILSTSGTIALTDNSINSITPSAAVTFTLPTVTDNAVFHQIFVQLNMSTAYTIDLGLGATPHWLTEDEPDLSEAGKYNIYYEYDKANQYWRAGVLIKGEAS